MNGVKMSKYKLVVYEGNGGNTKLMMYKNDLMFLGLDLSDRDYPNQEKDSDGWYTFPENSPLLCETSLLALLDCEHPSNYTVLDTWEEQ